MEPLFDILITRFIADKIGIVDNFLSVSLATHLKNNLADLQAKDLLRASGTGNLTFINQNKLVRGDKIYWLDRKHNNFYENEFFDLMDRFVIYLNSTCYTGITGYEFHYTRYETGSFYKKHVDQFKNNDSRQYSMILYLNDNWQQGDGGELCIHHADHLQTIPPNNGKSVFFKSNELEHEVLLTHKTRISITGWLKIN